MFIELAVTAGPHMGSSFQFAEHATFLVGRSPRVHFALPDKDPYVSRTHFLVEVNPPLCRLRDMNSRNGTLVNGKKVPEADLRHGDTIGIGTTTISVRLVDHDTSGSGTLDLPPTDRFAEIRSKAGSSVPTLLKLIVDDLHETWRTGELIHVEDYLAAFPSLANKEEHLIELLTAEAAAREARGERFAEEEWRRRFPKHADILINGRRLHTVDSGVKRECTTADYEPSPGTDRQELPRIPGYTILNLIGSGGMGSVYRGAHLATGEVVAIKTILPAITPVGSVIAKFLREADIVRRLEHPGIIKFRDSGSSEGLVWFAMEFVDGADARDTANRSGPLPVKRAVNWTLQLLNALDCAHRQGFVHRDVKPANMLIVERDRQELMK
ncbi:MAG: FHA domain-containing protein, partial [Planctomycetes bacterium]|nr:FHA domain-containing protein [Planctomycetota bacterium]